MTTKMSETPRKNENRIICLPFEQKSYFDVVQDDSKFRLLIVSIIEQFPELFPAEIHDGYQLKDIRHPKKLSVPYQSIKLKTNGISLTHRPSFVMPYLTALPCDAEKRFILEPLAKLCKLFHK